MIIINSEILPIDVKDFTFNKNLISLTFAKPEDLTQEAAVSSGESKQETKLSKEEAAKNQLKTVYYERVII